MPEVLISDDAGVTMNAVHTDDFLLPSFKFYPEPEKVFRAIPDFKVRDDDIMLATFPKTGKTNVLL